MGTDALLYGTSTASVSYKEAKKWSSCAKKVFGSDPQKV